MDVEIVGGSFAGLACARTCADRGLETVVWERKRDVGEAVHTTGILVQEVADAEDLPTDALRRVSGVRLYGPSLGWIDLETPGYAFFATDTAAILRAYADAARSAGAELRLGRTHRGERTGRMLVGADGPRSRVARANGLGRNRAFLTGVEAEFVGEVAIEQRLHVFLDSALAPGYIGWVVPGVGVTQVGVAARHPARPDLDRFARHIAPVVDLTRAARVGRRGGSIPVGGRVKRFASEDVVLVGDAAGLVSPLTGGGIHTALSSGRAAGLAIAAYLADGGPPPAVALERAYPRFAVKRALRVGIDLRPPNALLDAAIETSALRVLAKLVFFHHRGLLSAEAWRAMVGSRGPRAG